MKRLTKTVNGVVTYIGTGNKFGKWMLPAELSRCQIRAVMKRLAAYEDTGMEPEEINDMALEVATLKTIESMYDGFGKPDHIRDLLQAEQDGRLVVLPCKVGDRVFHVRRVTQAEAKRMGAPTRHRGIVYYEDRPFAIKEKLCTKSDYAQIGKTVFLTREEAEAALKAVRAE